MKTLLYNIDTGHKGEERDGYYMVDGKPGILPDYLVELVITYIPNPEYNSMTQTIEYREYPDLINKLWVKENYIRDLTEYEIDARKPIPPQTCTPRQFRLALIDLGYSLNEIDNQISLIPDDIERNKLKVEWEYAIEIERSNKNLNLLQNVLNISESEMDNIFILANKL